MAGRASIVGAAETNVGKVREHNEDAHFIDPELGIFVVCDGMGGHAAGEVASALAVKVIRERWTSDATQAVADRWLAQGTPEARKLLIQAVHDGVIAAHDAIVEEAKLDRSKSGMGTTLVGAMLVGGDVVFAHCGDSRAYLVRDGISMQLTEDHTLLARLLAAGVDVDVDNEGSRFKSMLTNALGIGQECKVSTFVVPVADGDRFLLCSDGITEYLKEAEIGEVLCKQPSPARAAQRLVEVALERGGGDNATAIVVRVLEAGETSRSADLLRREDEAIQACPLWARVTPQQRLRALRIALPRDHLAGERIAVQTLGDRVAWIIIEGEVDQDGEVRGAGALLYPEALLTDRPLPDKAGLAVSRGELRALALRSDDFREVCEDDPELGEVLLEALAAELAARKPARRTGKIAVQVDGTGKTDPGGFAAPVQPAVTPRPRAGTDPGSSHAPRAPAAAAAEPADQQPRGATPGGHGPALIVPVTERANADAAFDRALSQITGEPADRGGASDADLVARAPTARLTAPTAGRAAAPAKPMRAKPMEFSEPEISIEALVEIEADEPPLDEPESDRHAEVVMTVESDSARITEIVQDTSSQTITVTVDEPPEAEIIVVRPGRAITADDTSQVTGTIEAAPKAGKREPEN